MRSAHLKAVLPCPDGFTSRMAVRLHDKSRFAEAALFARSDQMMGRTFLPLISGRGLRWEFETVEDGVLFRLKFGGAVEQPLDVNLYLEGPNE